MTPITSPITQVTKSRDPPRRQGTYRVSKGVLGGLQGDPEGPAEWLGLGSRV